ncbi:MAG: hypothetical protein ABSH13_23230 [Candidatus Acidiferrum sp.]|jgi:hypothetical protein
MEDHRKEFLLRMYDQMFNDIDTHILVVWQSVGVVVGAFAVFALVEKNVIPIDYACSLMIMLSAWLIAHLYDAPYCYNRNLVIIANIERQFLGVTDLKDIHYYFGKHRAKSSMLTHLKIQYWLGIGIALLFAFYHLATRVLPGIHQPVQNFEFPRSLPYLFIAVSLVLLWRLRNNRVESYKEFLLNSPGIAVKTTGVTYGVGHPTERSEDERKPESPA